LEIDEELVDVINMDVAGEEEDVGTMGDTGEGIIDLHREKI